MADWKLVLFVMFIETHPHSHDLIKNVLNMPILTHFNISVACVFKGMSELMISPKIYTTSCDSSKKCTQANTVYFEVTLLLIYIFGVLSTLF